MPNKRPSNLSTQITKRKQYFIWYFRQFFVRLLHAVHDDEIMNIENTIKGRFLESYYKRSLMVNLNVENTNKSKTIKN